MNDDGQATPPLDGALPFPVANVLRAHGGVPGRIQLATRSDLTADGQFGEQWLLVDSQHLWVIGRHNGSADLRHRLPLDEIQDARGERCVGNGLLQVTVGGQPQVLLHYSNELTERFGRVAHYLHERAEMGPDVPVPNPDADSHRCLACGRSLPEGAGKVCPNCIQRGKLLKRLLLLARPYWGRMGLIVLLLLAGGPAAPLPDASAD